MSFTAPTRQPAVAEALRAALAVVRPGRLRAPRHRHVVPERELAALEQAPVGRQRVELGAHLVDAGEPDGQAVGDALARPRGRTARRTAAARPLAAGDWAVSMRRPVGSPARVAGDEAARRIGRVRGRCRPTASAAEFAHVAWPSMRTSATGCSGAVAVERGLGGKRAAGPEILIPVPSGDPLAGRPHGRALADAAGDVLLGRKSARVEAEPSARQVHQVAVGVDEPRQHGAAAEVDARPRRHPDSRRHVARRRRSVRRARPACRRWCRRRRACRCARWSGAWSWRRGRGLRRPGVPGLDGGSAR